LELAQAQRGLERAGYNVEGSLFAIANAEDALKKVRADPESTPQAIREAEIALAEAKLSSADAIDQQTEATDGLTKANDLLNEAVSGVSTSSDIYKELSDALTTAKENQAEAVIAVAEAIERETEAMEAFGKAIEEAGKIAGLYPIVAGKFNLNNPMAGSANAIPSTVTGNSSGYNPNGTVMNVTVQAGIVSSPDQIAQELADLSDRYQRLNGGNGFFGNGRA
jgi:tetratricopeptide (TPR) repeat protein